MFDTISKLVHCKFFGCRKHDSQSCSFPGCNPDVEFTSGSHTQLSDVMLHVIGCSFCYCQLCCTLWKIFYYLKENSLYSWSTSLQSWHRCRNFQTTSGSRTPLADVGYIYRAVVEMYWGCKSLQCTQTPMLCFGFASAALMFFALTVFVQKTGHQASSICQALDKYY